MELYDIVQRIADVHPRIAKSLRNAAEQLLRLNEYRMEGVAMALRARLSETLPMEATQPLPRNSG